LGKFKLSVIVDKIKQYPRIVLNTAYGMTDMTIEQNYQLYFLALNSYVTGKPDKKAKLIWHSLIENVVDKDSTCDDGLWKGIPIKRRVKSIGKEKPLSETSRTWIEKELKPYFADSLKKQKADLSEMAFEHIVNEDISSEEAKPFFDAYNKKQGFINRIKK